VKIFLILFLLIPSLSFGLTFKDGKQVEEEDVSIELNNKDNNFLPDHPLELGWWQPDKIYSICEVQSDYRFYHDQFDDGPDIATRVNTIYVTQGKYIGVTKSLHSNINWYVTDATSFPSKSNDVDKIRYSAVLDKIPNSKLYKCFKNRIERIKIEYTSYNVFTQNDLHNGLSDNEQIQAYGYMEIPKYNQCKGIEKFPVMFLIHHSGGKIFPSYKWQLHQQCVATFEPYVFKSRGYDRNYNDPDAEIQWVTETQGAVDTLQALDVVAKLSNVDADKIGIVGWSYGGTVTVEAQNMFNIKALNTKNRFAFHLAYYPYCYHYDDTETTDAPMTIFKGDKDTISYTQCDERVDMIDKPNKQQIVYANATHNFDGDAMEWDNLAEVGPACRIHTDSQGVETVRPSDNPDEWINLTANGGWFGDKIDAELIKKAMNLCWSRTQSMNEPNLEAYKDSQKILNDYIDVYLK
jgi:dienelactone hydrolase